MIFGRKTPPPRHTLPGHDWFAWYPVKLDCGRWAWFETVRRKFYRRYEYDWLGIGVPVDRPVYREIGDFCPQSCGRGALCDMQCVFREDDK